MIILPAIDIYNNQAVRLRQGRSEESVTYHQNPVVIASYFERINAPYLHIVDLNGAIEGSDVNLRTIRELADSISIPFEIGGGIRDEATVENYLSQGASRVIIGSKAVEDRNFISDLIRKYGERIAVSLDCRGEKVATNGWLETTEYNLFDLAEELENAGLSTLIYTDISRDGMLSGPNLEMLKELRNSLQMNIIASGGISSEEDLRALEALDLYAAITGKAVYEGKINLESLFNAR